MRREPQLSLSLGLLFPETEGGLQGYNRTWHRVQKARQQGQSRTGTLRLNCIMQTCTRNKIQPLVASDCTSGLGSGELILKILQVSLISSENHFSKWPMFKKIKKKKVTQSGITLRAQEKNIYILMVLRPYRNCHDYRTLGLYCFTYYVWDVMSWRQNPLKTAHKFCFFL